MQNHQDDYDKQEIESVLERLKAECGNLPEMEYFFALARTYFSGKAAEGKRPPVIALGPSVPEALIYASGASLRFLLGGSPKACMMAGDAVPRDTDPVSRSILGMLEAELASGTSEPLILIPVTGDSSRKLAYELKRRGARIHVIDIPPTKDMWAEEKWQRQWELLQETLQAYTGHWITNAGVHRQERMLETCRIQARRFEETAAAVEAFPAACRMFVLGSYYFSEKPETWADRVFFLTAKLKEIKEKRKIGTGGSLQAKRKGTVFLAGSPVYFPNYKLPFLLEDAGLELGGFYDAGVSRLLFPPRLSRNRWGVSRFLQEDCSEAYAGTPDMTERMVRMIRVRKPDGLIFQVLKGQISYDFQLEYVERECQRFGISVIRLETDYNYQDVEQLRLRLEAFQEMLAQKYYRKGERAV